MPNLDSILDGNLSLVLTALAIFAPGFIVSYIRAQFLTGKSRKISEAAVEYLVASAVYYAIVAPLVLVGIGVNLWSAYLILLIGPIITGLLLGYISQSEGVRQVSAKFGLRLVHPIPTSWDYLFSKLKEESWIIVTFKDGRQVFGYYGERSFSSDKNDSPDLYLETMTKDDFSPIEAGRDHGVWLDCRDVVAIEVIPDGTDS